MKPFLFAVATVALLVLLGLLGGNGSAADLDTIRAGAELRAAYPQVAGWLILLTHAGGATALVTIGVAATAWLFLRDRRGDAMWFAGSVFGTRLLIEIIKVVVARPRPAFDEHPVVVFSQSFPSAHAGNSMATFLALALFLAPERHRRTAVIAAVLAALAVGSTRPALGVHWPSDVMAGWLLGAALVSLGWALHRRQRSAA